MIQKNYLIKTILIKKNFYNTEQKKLGKFFGHKGPISISDENRQKRSIWATNRSKGTKKSEDQKRRMSENHWLKGKPLPIEIKLKGQKTQSKGQIVCVETGEVFMSSCEVQSKYPKLHHSKVTNSCKNNRLIHDGLHFMYYYGGSIPENIYKVRILETSEIFNSIKDLRKKYPEYDQRSIRSDCEGTYKHSSRSIRSKDYHFEWFKGDKNEFNSTIII